MQKPEITTREQANFDELSEPVMIAKLEDWLSQQ